MVRTGIGRAMGQRQVGAGAPGPRAEVPLAPAAVGACGVVLTLTLQAALPHRAQVSVQVALAPGGGGHRGPERSVNLGQVGTALGEGEPSLEGAGRVTLEATTTPTCWNSPSGQRCPDRPALQRAAPFPTFPEIKLPLDPLPWVSTPCPDAAARAFPPPRAGVLVTLTEMLSPNPLCS